MGRAKRTSGLVTQVLMVLFYAALMYKQSAVSLKRF
jgi:hypothetical protein